jgi:hypothetical protein
LVKDLRPDLRIIVAIREQSTDARLADDLAYLAILEELGAELIYDRDLLGLVLRRRRDIRLIFKDFGPTPQDSLAVFLKRACPRAQLVLFPHAYALHGSGQEPSAAEHRATKKDFDQEAIDALLLNTSLDVASWSKRFDEQKIRVTGATAYTDWWIAILMRAARPQLVALQKSAAGKKIVLLTTRGPHDVFLTEENYGYLLRNSIDAVLARDDTFVALKPHPREDIDHLRTMLPELPADRVQLTALNTLAVASISSVNLSFWSSAVLDAVAAGTPAIEFHRFHRPLPQSVIDDAGRVASIYTTLGLALKADTRELLDRALATALDDRDGFLRSQREALSRCFPRNEELLGSLRTLLGELLRAPVRHPTLGSTATSVLKIARFSGRDLLQELRGHRHGAD